MRAPPRPTRRLLIAGGGLCAAWLLLPRLAGLRPVALDFETLADPPGFRRLAGGPVSVGAGLADPLFGLGASVAASAGGTPPPPGPVCDALFGAPAPPGTVPLAYFSDHACPNCRSFEHRLADLVQAQGGRLRVTWHDWPILGPRSERAARAAVAAGLQGAYDPVHAALMGSPALPTAAYLRDLTRRVGIDPDRLLADMAGAEVARRLAVSAGLAARFGFAGTPGLVIGRTAVDGALGTRHLAALVARERADGAVPGCPPRRPA